MKTSNMLPICTALKILSTIENISFILYVYYCHLNHLFCQILVAGWYLIRANLSNGQTESIQLLVE